MELWNEYENGITPEAKFVKDLDKLEMLLQADHYEKRTIPLKLNRCFLSHRVFCVLCFVFYVLCFV